MHPTKHSPSEILEIGTRHIITSEKMMNAESTAVFVAVV
jgi:hypothetical protein